MDQKNTKKPPVNLEEVTKSREELEKVKKEADEYKNKYLRALADYQNYEKRVREEKNIAQEMVVMSFLIRLLPFLDHLEKAEVFVKDAGLKMVKNNFEKILKDIGLEEIHVEGKEFDPHLAEAVEIVEGDKDNIVKEIIRKGYILNGKVIRVAQVKVTKKKITADD